MLQQISDLIARRHRFLITAHERLDGDALGSELALGDMLRRMGKEALVYNQDPTPENYRFLPGSDDIVQTLPALEGFEVAIVLDCSELARVGREHGRIAAVPDLINIDHHLSNGGFSRLRLIDPQASSTGEMVWRLVTHLGVGVSREMANCLYTAILTDTGGFRYGSTSREALAAAAELVGAGADPQWISERVYEDNPEAKVRLLAAVLPSLSLEAGGRVGTLAVMQRDLVAAGALPEHTEGFVDLPRTIRGVEIAILFTEVKPGFFKLSLRSKAGVNVERVARALGGGGHINAAACRLEGELAEVRRRALAAIASLSPAA